MYCHLPIAVQISVLADTEESSDWIQILCIAVHVVHVYMMEFVSNLAA